MPKIKLDAVDRKILTALQRERRLTNVELAEEVGLSPQRCLRRARRLDEAGLVSSNRPPQDRNAAERGLTIFVGVKVDRRFDEEASAFCDAAHALPEVLSCRPSTGDADFILTVSLRDLAAYERFALDVLLRLPLVKDIRSNFAPQAEKTAEESSFAYSSGA